MVKQLISVQSADADNGGEIRINGVDHPLMVYSISDMSALPFGLLLNISQWQKSIDGDGDVNLTPSLLAHMVELFDYILPTLDKEILFTLSTEDVMRIAAAWMEKAGMLTPAGTAVVGDDDDDWDDDDDE